MARLTVPEVESLIKTCVAEGVTELKFGSLHVLFQGYKPKSTRHVQAQQHVIEELEKSVAGYDEWLKEPVPEEFK